MSVICLLSLSFFNSLLNQLLVGQRENVYPVGIPGLHGHHSYSYWGCMVPPDQLMCAGDEIGEWAQDISRFLKISMMLTLEILLVHLNCPLLFEIMLHHGHSCFTDTPTWLLMYWTIVLHAIVAIIFAGTPSDSKIWRCARILRSSPRRRNDLRRTGNGPRLSREEKLKTETVCVCTCIYTRYGLY